MRQVEAARRSILRVSYIGALVAAVGVGVLGAFYESKSREAHREATRATARAELGRLSAVLQGRIDGDIQLMRGFAGVVAYQPDIDLAQFGRLGAELTRDRSEIRSIAAAPDLRISMVYPVEGNEAALGLDYRTAPAQRPSVELARDLGATVVAGPVDLVQGGRGFVIRTPVFVGDGGEGLSFWGLVAAVLHENGLYEVAGLLEPDLTIDLAILGRDGQLDAGEVFFGDPAILDRDPVTAHVELPVGGWGLAAVPAGGWQVPPISWPARGLFLLGGSLVVAPIVGAGHLVASRQTRLAAVREREAELSRLSWRLEFALTASNVGVWDVDLETGILLWDDRAKALFGFSGRAGDFGDEDWTGVIHPEDRSRAVAEADAAVDGDGRFVTEYRIVRPDGEVRHIRDMARRYEGHDGTRRLVGLVWDVTPDVEIRDELDRRRVEAEAEAEVKSRFLAAMSHEIRTPMSGVLGVLGLMLEDPLPNRQRERARIALASAQNLLEILNDILDFSKLEARQIRIAEEPVDVRRLVGQTVQLMEPAAQAKGLTLDAAIASEVPRAVLTDPMRLRQVLTNLVSNSTKFTETGGIVIRVGYRGTDDGTLEIEVEDTGIGIGEAEREQIFLHFVQGDNSLTRRAGGTGLGLAISKQLVELMGGAIAVRSVPGMGSTFAFTVRARPAAEGTGDGQEGGAEEVELEPLRVLLAEDHATNQYLLGTYLRQAGHAVTVVSNGREAVERAASGEFDVVLMDVQMPDLDGLAATRAIRAGPAAKVPVIALTANAMPGDRDACLAAGMSDYLAKPIGVAALQAALRRACPDRRRPAAGRWTAAG